MPADRTMPSCISKLANAAAPMPRAAKEKKSRRLVDIQKPIRVQQYSAKRCEAMLLNQWQAGGNFSRGRRPTVGQLHGAGHLLGFVIARLALDTAGQVVRHAECQGVVEQRERLQRRRRRATLGCGGRGIGAVESI